MKENASLIVSQWCNRRGEGCIAPEEFGAENEIWNKISWEYRET